VVNHDLVKLLTVREWTYKIVIKTKQGRAAANQFSDSLNDTLYLLEK